MLVHHKAQLILLQEIYDEQTGELFFGRRVGLLDNDNRVCCINVKRSKSSRKYLRNAGCRANVRES